MEDIQNKTGDYKFAINRVGVSNITHPLQIKSKAEELVSTVGEFSMAVDLAKNLKGINMSRLPQLLADLNQDKFIFNDFKVDLKEILEAMKEKMETNDAYLELEFDYFLTKEAPVSQFKSLMPYNCQLEASLQENNYDFVLTVEVPVTTLCPCSKEISDYSAHNQRGYVQVSIRYSDLIWIEDIVEVVEEVGSCEIYPILKRVDEKYVTEKAYENPRFVEDMVRLVAEKLVADDRIDWFRVSSRHQESIHPHDAYAVIEQWK